jgi:hypothetical protein
MVIVNLTPIFQINWILLLKMKKSHSIAFPIELPDVIIFNKFNFGIIIRRNVS